MDPVSRRKSRLLFSCFGRIGVRRSDNASSDQAWFYSRQNQLCIKSETWSREEKRMDYLFPVGRN